MFSECRAKVRQLLESAWCVGPSSPFFADPISRVVGGRVKMTVAASSALEPAPRGLHL